MPAWKIALIVGIIVCVDLVIVTTIIRICGQTMRGLLKIYPPVQPGPGAVRRNFQSFKFDMINLGGSIHVAVDEHALHLRPAWLARRFGVPDLSIPWEGITLKKRGRSSTRVRVGNVDIVGPTWCLELAGPVPASQPS